MRVKHVGAPLSYDALSRVAKELCSGPVCHRQRCSQRGLGWASLYDWPLRHSRRRHCAGFHQSPLWQRQMVQSSTFTSIPAGMIVVPAKQFGPVTQEVGEEGIRRTRNRCVSPESVSFWRYGGGRHTAAGSWSRHSDLFTGMHRWACFCNTKALLLVSPSPSTWSALHPNAPRAQTPARRWLGSAERLKYREMEEEGGWS